MDTILKMVGGIMNLLGKKYKGSPRVLDSHGFIDETLTLDVPTDPRRGNLNIATASNDVESRFLSKIDDESDTSKEIK